MLTSPSTRMDETSNYQSIDETSESIIPPRAILSKVRIKQIVFSLVVILFVSIGAITFTQKASSRSTSTGDPSSDNPTQNMPFLIPTRTPAPSPGPNTTPTPTPTPTPKDFSNDETPQMTPVPSPASGSSSSSRSSSSSGNSSSSSSQSNSATRPPKATPATPLPPNAAQINPGQGNDKLPLTSSGSSSPSSSSSSLSSSSSSPSDQGTRRPSSATPTASPGASATSAPGTSSTAAPVTSPTSAPNTPPSSASSSSSSPTSTPQGSPSSSSAAATLADGSQQQTPSSTSSPGDSAPIASSSSPVPGSSIITPSSSSGNDTDPPAATQTPTSTSSPLPPIGSPTSVSPPSVPPTSPLLGAPPTESPVTPSPGAQSSGSSQASQSGSPSSPVSTNQPSTYGSTLSSFQSPANSAAQPATPSPSFAATGSTGSGSRPDQELTEPLPTPKRTTPTVKTASIFDAVHLQRIPQRAKARQPGKATLPAPIPAPTWLSPAAAPDTQIQGDNKAILSGDGLIRNPKEYPRQDCSLPTYLSKNGTLLAVGSNGVKQTLAIKGVNWLGMETNASIPFGLWSNDHNGTTLYEIASFLARNNFNSVRLPISLASMLHDTAPDLAFVNANENRALRLDNYTSTLQSIIKAFAYRQISVLISVDATTKAGTNISEEGYLHAIDKLTSSLCTSSYWNVLGLDLRSEGGQNTTWVDGPATDFRAAAIRIGNRMLQGCPSWVAFVRGTHESDDHLETGETYESDAWSRGGGLSKNKEFPITLSIPDKVVYAPHFYLPGVIPSANDVYTQRDNATELSDAELQETVHDAFDRMIGQLTTESERPAIVLSGFGGLYLEDKPSYRTSQRAVDYTAKLISEASGLIGGYAWTLNPETSFTHHGQAVQEGLVASDWRTANEPYLEALESLDEIPHLSVVQCFPLNFPRR